MARALADGLTILRLVLAVVLLVLGIVYGEAAITAAVIIVMLAWFTDNLDGFLARRDPQRRPSWIGQHEFAVDVAFTWATLFYVTLSGWIPPWLAIGYTVLAAGVGFWVGRKPVTVVFLRIIDVTLWVLLLIHYPTLGLIVTVYLITLAVVKWPRLSQGVPAWARGLRDVIRGKEG